MKTVYVYLIAAHVPQVYKDVEKVEVQRYNGFSETLVIFQKNITTHYLLHHVQNYSVVNDD